MADPVAVEGYIIGEALGTGGSSVVVAATRVSDGRRVAIKVTTAGPAHPGVRRAEREHRTLSDLDGVRGIVDIVERTTTTSGQPALVMDLVGQSCAERVRTEGPMSVADVVAIGISVADTLDALHRLGVVHRDIKPANVLVADEPGGSLKVRLADFDISLSATEDASTTTVSSMTPPHAAPERFTSDLDGGVAGDIWSLGSTLFTLLDARAPFGTAQDAGGFVGLVERIQYQPLPTIRRNDVPPDLVAVIERSMAKAPRQRWERAAHLAAALRSIDGDLRSGASATTSTAPHVTASDPTRWRTSLLIAATTAASVALAAWLAFR